MIYALKTSSLYNYPTGTTWQRTARQDTFKCRQYRVARAWQLTVAWIGLCWASSSHLGPLVAGLEQQTSKISVAVVGAGIGGSSASFFLRELVGEDVDIVVFDRADKPGGRTDVRAAVPLPRFCVVSNCVNW